MSSADGVSREVAWRVFADEYDDATLSFREGDDDRAPNYVVTPTGAKINRLFAVGVLTETENVGDDTDMYRARVSDPTGAFVAYAGQYQQDAMSFFADADPPMFVAIVGKARTYEPDDGDRIYTSIRPEEVNGVDGVTRDRWNVQTARQTLARIDAVASYFRGTAETDGTNALLARLHDLDATAEHYDLDAAYLTDLRRQCLEVLADHADEAIDEADAHVDLDLESPAGVQTGAAAEAGTDDDVAEAGTDDGVAEAADAGETGSDDSDFDADDFDDVSQEPVETGTDAEPGDTPATETTGSEPETDTATEPSEVAEAEEASVGDAEDAGTDAAGPADGDSGEAVGTSSTGDTDHAADETATEETGDGTGAGDSETDAEELEEGEWEWDEDERERLEDEFGAEFSSAADLDEDAETPEPGPSDDAGTADRGAEDADRETASTDPGESASADAGPTDGEAAPGSEGTDAAASSTDATEATEDSPSTAEESEAGETGAPDEAAETADDGSVQAETSDGGEDGEDPADVVLAVLEDAEPEGVPRDEAVEQATGRGVDRDAADDALDDLLMEGMCYETDDVVKPL